MKKNSFYNEIAQTNILPDGIQNSIKYEDYALYMVLKDKPKDINEKKDNIYDILE